MNFLNVLNNIEIELKNEENLEYFIINDTFGRNLILLKSTNDLNYFEDKFIDYKQAIRKIIILNDENRNDFLIKEIQKICNKNSITHRNVSYLSWSDRKEKIVQEIDYDNLITGYSFKGGMGRSSTLAYLSHYFYMLGKKIVILDCDFEAPGITTLFFDKKQREVKAGILDYLIDLNINKNIDNELLSDYFLEYPASKEGGNIYLFPTGIDYKNDDYIHKISKIDFNSQSYIDSFNKLIDSIQKHPILKPDMIFIDLRAGISESNGHIFENLSNLNLMFFNSEEQNINGLNTVLNSISNISDKDRYYILNSGIRFNDQTLRKKRLEELNNSLKNSSNKFKIFEIPFNQDMLELNKDNINKVDNSFLDDLKISIENKFFKLDTVINRTNIKTILEKLKKQFEKFTSNDKFNIEEDFRYFYIKDDIKLLLNEQKILILGNKGSGKSTLFEVLKQNYKPLIKNLNTNNHYFVGFSKDFIIDLSSNYFNKISDKAKKDKNIFERFWQFLTLYLLEKELNTNDKLFNSYEDIIDNISDLDKSLESDKRLKVINIELIQKDKIYTFLYDDLDLAIPNNLRDIFILNLIRFWQLNLYKYSNIKSKIFLRIDIFDKLNVEDKTHLNINILTLEWNKKEIISLIFKIIVASLDEEEIKLLNLNDVVKSYKNFDITQDIRILNRSLYTLFGNKINKTSLIMDDWIIKYLSDTNQIITPRTIYSFMFQTISNELNRLVIDNNDRKMVFQNFPKDYKEILKKVSKNRLEEYENEYPNNKQYIDKIINLGYYSFIFEDFKNEYKNIKNDTVKNYLSQLERSGFLKDDKQSKKYRLAEIYSPSLDLKKGKRNR